MISFVRIILFKHFKNKAARYTDKLVDLMRELRTISLMFSPIDYPSAPQPFGKVMKSLKILITSTEISLNIFRDYSFHIRSFYHFLPLLVFS